MTDQTETTARPRRRSYIESCFAILRKRREEASTPEEREDAMDALEVFCGSWGPSDEEEDDRELAAMPVVLCGLLQRSDAGAILKDSSTFGGCLSKVWPDDEQPRMEASLERAARQMLAEHLLPALSSDELDHIEWALYVQRPGVRIAFLDLCPPAEGEAEI